MSCCIATEDIVVLSLNRVITWTTCVCLCSRSVSLQDGHDSKEHEDGVCGGGDTALLHSVPSRRHCARPCLPLQRDPAGKGLRVPAQLCLCESIKTSLSVQCVHGTTMHHGCNVQALHKDTSLGIEAGSQDGHR